MIEMTEIRQLSATDLVERIELEREALAKLRFNHTVAGLESTTALKNMKRDLARLHLSGQQAHGCAQFPPRQGSAGGPWQIGEHHILFLCDT